MRQFSRPLFRVAVIYCKGVFYHEYAHYGFCRALKKLSRGRIILEDHVATSLSSSGMARLAKKAIGSQPDMIVSVGRLASHQVIAYQTEKKTVIPLVCIGADDLEESLTSHMRPLTAGIVTKVDNPLLPAQLLLYLKKDVRKVIIPCIKNPLLAPLYGRAQKLASFLTVHGVECQIANVDSFQSLCRVLVESKGGFAQVVLSLEGAGLGIHQSRLSQFCLKHNLIFFSSTLNGVEDGAAIGLGINPVIPGHKAAETCYKILMKEKDISTFSIEEIKDVRRLIINQKKLQKQILSISSTAEYLLMYGGFAQLLGESPA